MTIQVDTRVQSLSISNQRCVRGLGYTIRQTGIIISILNSNKNIELPKNNWSKNTKIFIKKAKTI